MRKTAAFSLSLSFVAAAALGSTPTLPLSPCRIEGIKHAVACGTFFVDEDRVARKGRKIPLSIVVLPATGSRRASDPFVWFEGGPGASVTGSAADYQAIWKEINRRRDIVLVDVRGTGRSNGLPCTGSDLSDVQHLLDGIVSDESLPNCRKRLEEHADLALYTDSLAADDIDDVRAALGYEKLNVAGASGGTRTAQVYARQHPDRVRTLVLWDPVSTGDRMPLMFARDAQDALDRVIASCRAQEDCRRKFPDTGAELSRLLTRLTGRAEPVEATDEATKKKLQLRLSRNGLAQTVRAMLYSPRTASLLPLQLHEAAQGNFKPLGESAAAFASSMLGAIDYGDFLCISCSEDVPFYSDAEAEAAAADTFLGSFRARRQKEICRQWPSRPVPAEFLEPVHSEAPALLIGGDLDPVTTARVMTKVAREMPRSVQVIVKGGSHDFEGMKGASCIDRIMAAFIDAGSERGLDTTCVSKIRPVPFALR